MTHQLRCRVTVGPDTTLCGEPVGPGISALKYPAPGELTCKECKAAVEKIKASYSRSGKFSSEY